MQNDHVPNEETQAAIAELESGNGIKHTAVSDLMADLEKDDASDNKIVAANPQITFVMIKNDAIVNNVHWSIIEKLKAHNFKIIGSIENDLNGIVKNGDALIEKFYFEHVDKPYFPNLLEGLRHSIPLVVEYIGSDDGTDAVTRMRTLIGATDSRKAEPHTIRAEFGGHRYNSDAPMAANAIHASDSFENVCREIKLFFAEDDDFWSSTGTIVVGDLYVDKDVPHVKGVFY